MADLETLSKLAHQRFCLVANRSSEEWYKLPIQIRDGWRAAILATIEALQNEQPPEIPPSLMAPLDQFGVVELQSFRDTWRKLQNQPQWIAHAAQAIEEINTEIERRTNANSDN